MSFDFATSVMPGWHTTIFPPYFVIGAIFSGFAMVITLMTFMRGYFGMKNYITANHTEYMAKIRMLTGLLVGFVYSTEFFMAWYSGSEVRRDVACPGPRRVRGRRARAAGSRPSSSSSSPSPSAS